ncbi:MAG: hypothetical protein NC225_07515 [Clostridium sp.]|nr:hypothetical protein [Clostridium sp.]MCM1460770.1 hypothetical protein [Bacteroides sp.]
MQLSNKEDSVTTEQYRQMKQLETRIESLGISVDIEEKEISSLRLKEERLNNDFKTTCVFVVISIVILIWIFKNAYSFLTNMLSYTYVAVMVFGGIVSFIGYTVRRVMKHFPMYIHCRQEEKGGSADMTNYVYQIKQHERRKAEYTKELELLNQEYDSMIEE